jgi:hypothetical protein
MQLVFGAVIVKAEDCGPPELLIAKPFAFGSGEGRTAIVEAVDAGDVDVDDVDVDVVVVASLIVVVVDSGGVMFSTLCVIPVMLWSSCWC